MQRCERKNTYKIENNNREIRTLSPIMLGCGKISKQQRKAGFFRRKAQIFTAKKNSPSGYDFLFEITNKTKSKKEFFFSEEDVCYRKKFFRQEGEILDVLSKNVAKTHFCLDSVVSAMLSEKILKL